MDEAHGRFNFVDVLPALAARTRIFHVEVGRVDHKLHFFADRQHGNRDSRRVNATIFFRVWNALHSVCASLITQIFIDVFAAHFKRSVLVAAHVARRAFEFFPAPFFFCCVALICTGKFCGKK